MRKRRTREVHRARLRVPGSGPARWRPAFLPWEFLPAGLLQRARAGEALRPFRATPPVATRGLATRSRAFP